MTLNPISVQSSLAIHWVEFDKLSSIFTSPAHASLWTLELSSVHMSCNVFSEGFGPATHFRAALMRVCDQRPAFWFWAITGTAFAMTHLPLALRFASCSFHPSWTTRSKTRRAVISPCARMISSLNLRFSKISNSFSRTRTSFSSFSELLLQFHQLLECHQAPVRLWNLIDSLKERVTWGLTTASCPHWTRCVWQAKTRRAPQHQNNDKANAGQSIERQHHCWSCYEFQWLRADKGHQYFSQKAVTNIACPRLRDLLTLSRLLLRKASHVWRFVCNTCSLKLGLPTRRWTRMIIFSTERTKDTSIPSSNPKHKHKTQQPQQLSPSSKPNIDTSL